MTFQHVVQGIRLATPIWTPDLQQHALVVEVFKAGSANYIGQHHLLSSIIMQSADGFLEYRPI